MRLRLTILGALVLGWFLIPTSRAEGTDCNACYRHAALNYHTCMWEGFEAGFCVGGYEAQMEECDGLCQPPEDPV